MQIYPWQHHVWNQLTNRYQMDHLPCALLLSGQEGIGKFDLACTFSKTLLCAMSKETACASCQSCQLFSSNNHPDFYVLRPEQDSQVIKIDQIREVIERLLQTPKISNRQVVVVQSAEKMNISAANALLKTLEEPPGNVIFLLTSSTPYQLPATIRSRCQHQRCMVEEDAIGLKWLLTQISDQPAAKLLWHMSNKSPLLAKRLFEYDYLKVRNVILKGMQDIYNKNKLPIDISKAISTFDIIPILQNWTALMIDLWQIKHQVKLNHFINQDQLETLTSLARLMETKAIEQFYALLLEAIDAEQSQINLNKALVLDNLWLQFAHYIIEVNAR